MYEIIDKRNIAQRKVRDKHTQRSALPSPYMLHDSRNDTADIAVLLRIKAQRAFGNETDKSRRDVKYGFKLSALSRGDRRALLCRNHAQKILRKFAVHDQYENPYRKIAFNGRAERMHTTRKRRQMHDDVRKGIEHFSEVAHFTIFARKKSV